MPACLRDIKRALEQQGGALEEPRSGSHWKAKLGGDCYPVPAHNGLKTEISDAYVNGLCRSLRNLDKSKFKKDL